jgi:hypothetical protein
LVGAWLWFCPWLGGLTALASTPLALTVWLLAWRDLERMRAGLVDPHGWTATATARNYGVAGLVLGAWGSLFWGTVGLFWLLKG